MSGPPVNFWNDERPADHRVVHGLRVHLALEAQPPQQPLGFERVVADGVAGVERRQELVDRSHAATPIALVIADVKIAPGAGQVEVADALLARAARGARAAHPR